ncbi:ARM repeat superfamily protein [Abeliophyllum distichum]|uniref:ARM repeat superfamily protein n=1 Tax=Abeliophyllum distichum TaxID=126358 RepID=A0ABD1PBR9_9LAMI
MKDDEKNVLAVLGRSNIAALVQLLTATSPRIGEKTVTVICWLAESGSCENWLVSEGVLPPLIRLVESGNAVNREKATISLQRLSMSAETARSIVGHGGVMPLIEICQTGDSVMQVAVACMLKNISAVPEVRQALSEEGIIKTIHCLKKLQSGALRNLVGVISVDVLVSLGLLPWLVHVLKSVSLGAQKAAASVICLICNSSEMKRLVCESGCIPLLIKMLEAKSNNVREVVAQAISSLMTLSHNSREVKRDDKSVPNLVVLLDPSPQNTAKKYAISFLPILAFLKQKVYLCEQKLPKRMLRLQDRIEGNDCNSENGGDEGGEESAEEERVGNKEIRRKLEDLKTSPFEGGDLRIISLGKIVKDSDNMVLAILL